MWHGHLIRRVSSQSSPHHALPPRRMYTPTLDGYERFLRDCLVLARGKGTPPRVRGLWTPPGATRHPRQRSR
jgi:hypothetical protein